MFSSLVVFLTIVSATEMQEDKSNDNLLNADQQRENPIKFTPVADLRDNQQIDLIPVNKQIANEDQKIDILQKILDFYAVDLKSSQLAPPYSPETVKLIQQKICKVILRTKIEESKKYFDCLKEINESFKDEERLCVKINSMLNESTTEEIIIVAINHWLSAIANTKSVTEFLKSVYPDLTPSDIHAFILEKVSNEILMLVHKYENDDINAEIKEFLCKILFFCFPSNEPFLEGLEYLQDEFSFISNLIVFMLFEFPKEDSENPKVNEFLLKKSELLKLLENEEDVVKRDLIYDEIVKI